MLPIPVALTLKTPSTGEILLYAICLESDYQRFINSCTIVEENTTIMHETLFRSMYPEAYAKYVQSNVLDCIGVWLEEMHRGSKDFTIDDNMLLTESYSIVAHANYLCISLYYGCDAFEAAKLILMLKEKIPIEIGYEIDIIHCSAFHQYSNN